MLTAFVNAKNDNKHLRSCSGVVCVNSWEIDETAAHHGGKEGRVITVPIHRFIWVV